MQSEPDQTRQRLARSELRIAAFWTVGALAGLAASAQIVVTGATRLADTLGVSDGVVGLSLVALGTSVPELATTIACARRGNTDMIIGNVLGSKFFNSLAVLGIAGIAGNGQLVNPPTNSLVAMLAISVLALVLGAIRQSYGRIDATVLLACYPVVLLVGTT